MKYTIDYLKEIIKDADAILIGLGSGMSASGGLDYTNKEIFENLYKDFSNCGYQNIFDAVSNHWVTSINDENCNRYWKFWTRHIYNIRYNVGITKPYELLNNIVSKKEHFVITTNGDGQSQKIFKNVYAPQGDYSLLQCRVNCMDKIYCNKDFIYNNLEELKEIPRCPDCGDFLIPNLRCDNFFCETEGSKYFDDYYNFIIKNKDKKLLLIEIGVGYNTPSIIRFPFDKLSTLENVTLMRINKTDARVNDGEIGIEDDVLKVLESL